MEKSIIKIKGETKMQNLNDNLETTNEFEAQACEKTNSSVKTGLIVTGIAGAIFVIVTLGRRWALRKRAIAALEGTTEVKTVKKTKSAKETAE